MAPKPKTLINKERRDKYREKGFVNPETWVPREAVEDLAKHVAKLVKKYTKKRQNHLAEEVGVSS